MFFNPPTQTIAGRYVLLKDEVLGSGSFGVVYKGYLKKKPELPLAIKVLDLSKYPKSFIPEMEKMVKNEIGSLEDLLHPNILNLIYIEKESDSVYFVTEFCEDGDLSNKKGELSLNKIMFYFKQIVKGMKFAHENNYIHRDIKPANILISRDVVKLADFGLSKFVEKSMIENKRTSVGTPLYMAPEIYYEKSIDLQSNSPPIGFLLGKCDVWSAGIMLYELIYGTPPWVGETPYATQKKIKKEKLTFPKSPKIDKTIKDMIKKMLKKDPEERICSKKLLKHPALSKDYDSDIKEEPPTFLNHLKQKSLFFAGLASEIGENGKILSIPRSSRTFLEILFKKMELIYLQKIQKVCEDPDKYKKHLPLKMRHKRNLKGFKLIYSKDFEEKREFFIKNYINSYQSDHAQYMKYVLSENFQAKKGFQEEYNRLLGKVLDKFRDVFGFNLSQINKNQEMNDETLRLALKIFHINTYNCITEKFEFDRKNNDQPFEDYSEYLNGLTRKKIIQKILKYYGKSFQKKKKY